MKLTAILVAAGRGRRMQAAGNKALLELNGRPVLDYGLAMWYERSDTMIIAIHPDDEAQVAAICAPYAAKTRLVYGGDCRAASVAQALAALPAGADPTQELVAVHDTARPLTHHSDIERVIAAARTHQAALLAGTVHDTIRYRAEEGLCGTVIPRENLLAVQTPQIFRRDILCRAYQAASPQLLARFTDDAALLQALGLPCAYVLGQHINLKLTQPEDLWLAAAILKERGDISCV